MQRERRQTFQQALEALGIEDSDTEEYDDQEEYVDETVVQRT